MTDFWSLVIARWMAARIGSAYVPIPDAGRLSYYQCMIADAKYMSARALALAGSVSVLKMIYSP